MAHVIDAKERTSDIRLLNKVPFSKMLLTDAVQKGLQQAGFVYPTVVQGNAIPVGKAGIDLVIQSKSGTGKSLIFSVILLEGYKPGVALPQSLIIVPTREIALQIEELLNKLGKFCTAFKAVSAIGGIDVNDDRKHLQKAKAIVGTPGRISHLIRNNFLNTSKIRYLVLDEADKMLTDTFQQDVHEIIKSLQDREKRQTIACSATFCNYMDKKLLVLMKNPLLISTEKATTFLVGIKQLIYQLPEENASILEMAGKVAAVKRIFSYVSFKQCLIFAGSQSRADSYRNALEREGWPCEVITGAHDQKVRSQIFKNFRDFTTRIIVTTDLLARGVDSEHVNLVINMEVPNDGPTYLHRIGRAGRFSTHGIAITFIASPKDHEKFSHLLDSIGKGMRVLHFPEEPVTDLWDFTDSEKEAEIIGIYEKYRKDFSDVEHNISEIYTKTSNGEIIQTGLVESCNGKVTKRVIMNEKPDNLNEPCNAIDKQSALYNHLELNLQNASTQPQPAAIPELDSSPSLSNKKEFPVDMLIDKSESNSKLNLDLFDDYNNAMDCEQSIDDDDKQDSISQVNNSTKVTDNSIDSSYSTQSPKLTKRRTQSSHLNKSSTQSPQLSRSFLKLVVDTKSTGAKQKDIFDDYSSYVEQNNDTHDNDLRSALSAKRSAVAGTESEDSSLLGEDHSDKNRDKKSIAVTAKTSINLKSTVLDIKLPTSSSAAGNSQVIDTGKSDSKNELQQQAVESESSKSRATPELYNYASSDTVNMSDDELLESSITPATPPSCVNRYPSSDMDSTLSAESRTADSSGFAEDTSTGGSSGIATSTPKSDSSIDYDEEFDSSETYTESDYNDDEEDYDDDDDDNISTSGSSEHDYCSTKYRTEDDDTLAGPSKITTETDLRLSSKITAHWTEIYWRQVQQIQNYSKIYKDVMQLSKLNK